MSTTDDRWRRSLRTTRRRLSPADRHQGVAEGDRLVAELVVGVAEDIVHVEDGAAVPPVERVESNDRNGARRVNN